MNRLHKYCFFLHLFYFMYKLVGRIYAFSFVGAYAGNLLICIFVLRICAFDHIVIGSIEMFVQHLSCIYLNHRNNRISFNDIKILHGKKQFAHDCQTHTHTHAHKMHALSFIFIGFFFCEFNEYINK